MLSRIGTGVCSGVCTAVCAVFALAGSALAEIEPHETLFLWTSTSANATVGTTSQQVRDAYLAAHPGVHDLDLNLAFLDPAMFDQSDPPANAVTDIGITAEAFEMQVRQPILNYIETNQLEIICLVTSRGLPALVLERFDFNNFGHGQSEGVICSFESALTKLGLEGPGDVVPQVGSRPNPYYSALNLPLRDYLAQSCALRENTYGHGQLFAVSRLDAAQYPGGGNEDRAQPIIDLINRSANLPPINKQAVTIVMDDNPGGCQDHLESRQAAQSMRNAGWIVYYDDSKRFMHGANQPASEATCVCEAPDAPPDPVCQTTEPGMEDVYTAWPELVHVSLGVIHDEICGGNSTFECASPFIARHYDAHPAALWVTGESYNGLHIWRHLTHHGDALDWSSRSGGGFALVNAFAPPGQVTASKADAVMVNFYQHGLSWGEAALSSLRRVGYMQTAIGDPLAKVVVYDSDVNGDRRVDIQDLLLVQAGFGVSPDGFPAPRKLDAAASVRQRRAAGTVDINRDGFVNGADLALVAQAFGRDADDAALNLIPDPAYAPDPLDFCAIADEITDRAFYRCHGDVNGDFTVDQRDMQTVEQHMGCGCSDFDLNDDTMVDAADLAIASTFGSLEPLADVDGSGTVDCTDLDLVNSNICQNNCPPENLIYDLNCDGDVDLVDALLVMEFTDC